MQPHYSQSSRENATPSSGTSPLAYYKEVHPPGNVHSADDALVCGVKLCSGNTDKGDTKKFVIFRLANRVASNQTFISCGLSARAGE